jgi:hypothetical protein
LLNSHDKELAIDTSVDTLKQCAVEKEEKPEPNERTMAVLKLTKGLGVTEASIKVFEDIDWLEQ